MIIGSNNNNFNNNFSTHNFTKNNPKESAKINNKNKKETFGFNEDLTVFKHINPTNNEAMYNKSLAMLNERYKNNLITLDEFQKQCAKIDKMRQKNIEK